MKNNLISRALPRQHFRLAASTILLFPIRMFLGFGWLRAGIEKVIDWSWWTGEELQRFLIEQRPLALPFMEPLIDGLFEPFVVAISLTVMIAQLAIGVAFVTTRYFRQALWVGVAMNLVFVAMGAVDPSVFYLVIQLSLLAAVSLGLFGGERREPNPVSVGLKLGAAGVMGAMAMTIAPADVIHDPAVILATVALLAAATEALGWFVHVGDDEPIRRLGAPVTQPISV